MSDTKNSPKLAEADGDRQNDERIESPEEFYREFTKRLDVREILRRLANWQPPDDEPTPRGG